MSQTQKVSCELWDRRAFKFQENKIDVLKKEGEGGGGEEPGPKATSGWLHKAIEHTAEL